MAPVGYVAQRIITGFGLKVGNLNNPTDIYVDDDKVVHVNCSDAKMVSVITSNKLRGARLSENSVPVNSASFKITDDMRYVRIIVKDFEGNCAYSNPIFCDELS